MNIFQSLNCELSFFFFFFYSSNYKKLRFDYSHVIVLLHPGNSIIQPNDDMVC